MRRSPTPRTRAARWALLLAASAVTAACAPRVDPRSPFDEDDPRAGSAAPAPAEPPPADAVATVAAEPPPYDGPVVRVGTIERGALTTVLDAQPGELLRCFEVAAVEQAGKFAGWRLVRFLRTCRRFDGIDLAAGDVLVSVNGRVLMKPTDLAELWKELYGADAIVAELRRGSERFTLRWEVKAAAAATGP